ncbi:PQQ-binding-like beta-propeller repeat protein [Streptomyces sp. NPDC090741]|uniref:outer membrane protein assembly factor BamB family protein n=1 Tax=Streptomyces sp. NPDC090741 TaxID=3365967 RepID=UPI0037F16F5E
MLAVAPRDLETALRLSERIGSAGARLLALCQVARDRAEAGDAAGGARALEQADEELPRFLEERAAWLREEAAHHAEQGRPVQAERLRAQAAALLSHHPEEAADQKADHALSSVAEARAGVRQAALRPLDPAAARQGADAARALPDPALRARALARTARECLATDGMPWLAEASAGVGSPPPPGTTALGGPDTGPGAPPSPPPAAPGTRAWHTGARPDALYAAGAHVVWRSGSEVGCVRAGVGATRWSAHADEGAAAPPLPGAGRVLVSCVADPATVYVDVRRDDGPGVRIVAREPRDGRVRWWRDLPKAGPALRGAGPVLVHEAQGELTALRATTGEVEWQRSLPDGTRSLAAVGDCLVLADGRWLQALDLRSGRRLWTQLRNSESSERTSDQQPVHLVEGASLRAVDRGTGREVWRFALGTPAERLLVESGTVYAAAHHPVRGDRVFALDARTGAPLWQRTVVRREGTGCALELLGLRPGGLYVKAARGGRRGRLGRESGPFVAVLDPATGKPRRRWEQPGLADGDTLLVGDRLVLSRPELSAYALP